MIRDFKDDGNYGKCWMENAALEAMITSVRCAEIMNKHTNLEKIRES